MDIDRLEWAKQLVHNAVRSPHTQQAYEYALEQFFQWAAGRAISRESVQGYVTWLGEMKFSPSTINQRLAAIRKLASEAQRCGYVDSETAQAIITVAGVSQKGRRLGRWLGWEEARTLLQAPNPHSIRGMRDRALLGVLVTCALRRGELSRMNCEHLARRTAAKLCRAKGGELEQIKFLLGHESILTTERYLGSEQDLKNAVNDALVFE
jgi:site-specific recombinase XerD